MCPPPGTFFARPAPRASRFPRVLRRSSSSGLSSALLRMPSTSRITVASASVGSRRSRRQPSSSQSCVTSQNASRLLVAVQWRGDRQWTPEPTSCRHPRCRCAPSAPRMHHALHVSRRKARPHAPSAASNCHCWARSVSASAAQSYVSPIDLCSVHSARRGFALVIGELLNDAAARNHLAPIRCPFHIDACGRKCLA